VVRLDASAGGNARAPLQLRDATVAEFRAVVGRDPTPRWCAGVLLREGRVAALGAVLWFPYSGAEPNRMLAWAAYHCIEPMPLLTVFRAVLAALRHLGRLGEFAVYAYAPTKDVERLLTRLGFWPCTELAARPGCGEVWVCDPVTVGLRKRAPAAACPCERDERTSTGSAQWAN
jgi:hypothetical protein